MLSNTSLEIHSLKNAIHHDFRASPAPAFSALQHLARKQRRSWTPGAGRQDAYVMVVSEAVENPKNGWLIGG